MNVAEVRALAANIRAEMAKAVVGQTETVDLMEIDLAETVRVLKHYGSSYQDGA